MVWMADTLMTNIIHLVKTDERFSTAKSNILSVDTLIIDEISMISAKVLNQVQVLCKGIRNYDALFGNIQTLLVGDFLQLPPSLMNPMEILTTSVSLAAWFNTHFPYKINLQIVHRQDEPSLIKCVYELEAGEPSDEWIALLKSLDRPL